MRNIISRFCDFYLKHYVGSISVVGVIFLAAVYLTSTLTINSDQIDLLPPDVPQVVEAQKITEMLSGLGFLILTLKMKERSPADKLVEEAVPLKIRSRDAEAQILLDKATELYAKDEAKNIKDGEILKKASDALFAELNPLDEVQYIQYKFDLDFIKDRILYYWQPADLREAFRRVGLKRDELVRKADPFYLDFGEDDYELDLSDMIKKYRRIGKKEITDDYYISPDRRLMIMLVKPSFSLSDIEASRLLVEKVRSIIQQKGLDKMGVEVGFTGTFAQFVDAYDSVKNSLRPTILLSLTGIAVILFFFFRRKRLIFALLVSLIFAIVTTFGLTAIVIGQLNIVTAIFGGILAGLGIDFGIHFIFRFREEFWKSGDLHSAIKEAIIQTGSAAIFSAATTAGAFSALITSDFGGFSEFGMISAYGIIITAVSMFFVTPLQLVIFDRFSSKFLENLKQKPQEKLFARWSFDRLNIPQYSRKILLVSLVLFVICGFFSSKIEFDHDARNMLEATAKTEMMRQETDIRFELSGDPMAIATDTIDEAASLWGYFDPLDETFDGTVSQVVSLFAFIPSPEQQLEDYKIIEEFKRENTMIKKALLPEDMQQHWKIYDTVINQKPFSFKDIPEFIRAQFQNVPESSHKGWLTFVYPDVNHMYLAHDLARLDRLIGEIHYPIVSRRHVRRMVYHIPEWEKQTGRSFDGSTEKKKMFGLELSQRDIQGLLDIANNISETDLQQFEFFPMANDVILKKRPFATLEELQAEKKVAHTTGSTILIAQFTYIVQRESKYIIFGTSILVILILFVSFRKLAAVAFCLVPLVTGMVFMLGLMVIFDVRINYFNVAVLPILIGYGMNNGIFLYHRFMECNSVSIMLARTGSAVVASSLTTLAGWGALSIAMHPGIRSMGYVACIGIGALLIVSITVLPAILQWALDYKASKTANAGAETD